MHSKVVELHYH